MTVKSLTVPILVFGSLALAVASFSATSQDASAPTPQTASMKRAPKTMALACDGSDCPLLKGYPQTAGMRSGVVWLKPGETVGWHTTAANEETLVILRGKGEVEIDGAASMPVEPGLTAYVPPATRHNVKNTGDAELEYVYVVAPAAKL